MVHKSRVRTVIEDLNVIDLTVDDDLTVTGVSTIDGAAMEANTAATANAAGGVTAVELGAIVRRSQYTCTDVTATILEANDYASVKLCDLPDGNIIIIGCLINLVATGTGGVDTLANIDFALGTVANTSVDFSNAGEDNLAAKIDSSAGGVIQGGPVSGSVLLAASTTSVYLNYVDAIATDGTIVANGTVELFYIDLGDPTA